MLAPETALFVEVYAVVMHEILPSRVANLGWPCPMWEEIDLEFDGLHGVLANGRYIFEPLDPEDCSFENLGPLETCKRLDAMVARFLAQANQEPEPAPLPSPTPYLDDLNAVTLQEIYFSGSIVDQCFTATPFLAYLKGKS